MSKAVRYVTDLDKHIGARIRVLRQLKELSQTELADVIGVTFQQIQKYEKGTNRVSASRLWVLAEYLDVPIDYFFIGAVEEKDLGQPDPNLEVIWDFVQSPEGVSLVQAYSQVKQKPIRKKVLALIRSLAGLEEDDEITG